MAKRCRICLHGDKWILGDAHILYQDFVLEMHFFYFWDTRILYQNFILEMHIFCIKILFWTIFFKEGTYSISNILYIVLFRSMLIFCFKISFGKCTYFLAVLAALYTYLPLARTEWVIHSWFAIHGHRCHIERTFPKFFF